MNHKTGGYALALGAGGAIAFIVAAAIALALLLAFLKFDQRLLEISIGRLGLVTEAVRHQGETGLALGLQLTELEDLTDVLRRAASTRDVLRIEILDAGGQVLFSSASGSVGARIETQDLLADASGRFRYRTQGDELLLLARLHDGDGRFVGEVAVRAGLAAQRKELEQVRLDLLRSAAPVIAAALLVTLLAVAMTVRRSALGDAGEDLGDEPERDRP